jgi:hypothetical protein
MPQEFKGQPFIYLTNHTLLFSRIEANTLDTQLNWSVYLEFVQVSCYLSPNGINQVEIA